MRAGRVVAMVVAASFALAGCAAAQRTLTAAEQAPQLTVLLHRVDAALATHRFVAARADLRRLRVAVVKARDAGDLGDADATRVLQAIGRLEGMLPAATPSPATTTSTMLGTPTSAPSRSPRSKPSAHAPVSTPTPTPTSAPSSTPSPSASSTPTASATPTVGQTREASPTASPTGP